VSAAVVEVALVSVCRHDRMTMPGDAAPISSIVLMGDPRVTAIPVGDNGEELAGVRAHGLRVSSFRADDAGDFAYVRTGLATRLVQAAGALPPGAHLLIIEGYRPPALQRRYFDDYLRSLRATTPDRDEERLRMLTSRYVSPPEIAPHSAGAAIDLTLCADDGTELDLGTAVNANPEQSAGACYTHHPSVGGEARRNRAALTGALRAAGFVNYPTEWWHWSYGDRYWAMATGAPSAIYGAINRR
jgi:D-alanyl-D-alanine dipeptidase